MKLVKPSQLDTSNPGLWPIYYHILLWIVLIFLIFFLYGKIAREGLLYEQEAKRSEITKLEQEYQTLYQYQLDLPLYEQRKSELREKLRSLLVFLPAKTEMPNLIDDTYKAAYDSGINFTEFTPKPSIEKDFYNIEPISLSTETQFRNFAQFVQKIGELPRVLNVRGFVIDSKDSSSLTITSELETYIYNQDVNKYIGSSDGDIK